MGKTTCAFFRPGTGKMLYASTHHDPESPEHAERRARARASGKERRYAWDYDPEMELYVVRRGTARERRLTNAGLRRRGELLPGRAVDRVLVDAQAYERELDAEEQAQLNRSALLCRDLPHAADGSSCSA